MAVEWALGKTGGDVGKATKLLGVHRNTVGSVRRQVEGERSVPGRLRDCP